MNLQIDFKEYEAEEGQKQGDVRYEVKDMLSQLSYLENQYEQKRKTINRRKKNLHWSLVVYIGCAVFCGIIAKIMSINWTFGGIASIIFIVFMVLLLISAARIILTIIRHKKVNGNAYSLMDEALDLIQLKKRLAADRQALEEYLMKEGASIEEGKSLLEEVRSHLKEKDRKADFFFGEKIK